MSGKASKSRRPSRQSRREISLFGIAALLAVSAAMAQVAVAPPEIDVHASTVEIADTELDLKAILPE